MEKNKLALFVLLAVVVILSSILIISETNIIHLKNNVVIHDYIYLNDIVEDEKGAGYMLITRHKESPYIADIVSFDNNESFKFFVLSDNAIYKQQVNIDVLNEPKGRYYYNIIVYINDKEFIQEMSFKIW